MARIESYSPGRVVVDGVELRRDVIVLPDRVLFDWWRRDGHSLVIEDLADVLDELRERLVVGCGYAGRLKPDPSVVEALAKRGVQVEALPTPDAVDRFGVIYALLNVSTGQRLYVKTMLNEPELELRSVFSLWKGADWMEREIFDMYGIRFEGHPNLRRILMPDEFAAYPLRKDYPLRGRGERHNFPVITRAES